MNYEQANVLLDTLDIPIDQLFILSNFLKNDNTRNENAFKTQQKYYKYMIEKYDGSNEEINDIVEKIVFEKSHEYFTNEKCVFDSEQYLNLKHDISFFSWISIIEIFLRGG
jgi:hypothetical protein